MADFGNAAEQAKQFWATRSGRQKALLLSGAGITVILLTVFVRLLGTPDYKPLYQDMEPADAQSLATQLDAQNIPHKISPDGKTISVPADKLDAARLQTASQGQPHSGRLGFELFDKVSWGQTEFDEKVAYQRAMEGELERTIKTLADVESARVHLVMPTDSVFLDRERSAKASVILKLKRNGLSKDAVMAISRLVSGAVDGLKPEDVAIIDADSDRSLGLGHDDGDTGEGEETRLTQRLISTLEPIVGANAIRASVNIDYDQDSTEENEEKYDPSVSALLSVQRTEDDAGGGAAPSGVPGTTSNIPTDKKPKPVPVDTTTAKQTSKSENAQYGVNKTVIHTISPAGKIRRVTAALLVDDELVRSGQGNKTTFSKRPRSQEELNKIQELAQAAIGFDTKRGDTISVQSISFDGNAVNTDLPAAGWATEVQKTVTDYSALLRPLSLLLLFVLAYLFVIRPVQKQALSRNELSAGLQPALATSNAQSLSAGASFSGDHVQRAAQLKMQAFELARLKPVDTARAMQAWMREEKE
jgi:flagellar M-ring protein FliF